MRYISIQSVKMQLVYNITTEERKTPDDHKEVENLPKHIPEIYERAHSRATQAEFFQNIRPTPELYMVNDTDGLLALVRYAQNGFTMSRMSKIVSLSEKGRMSLPRHYDIFESMEIGCVSPEEILSATLCVKIHLPKSVSVDAVKFHANDTRYIIPDSDQQSNELVAHYIPIKTINNPTGKLIKFFDTPLLVACERFAQYTICVNFRKNYYNDPNTGKNVKINVGFLNSSERCFAVQNFNICYQMNH